MRNFILKVLIFLLPLAGLLVLQCLVDPLDFYSETQLLPPVSLSVRAAKVDNYLDHTDRDFDTFIIGSSRMMRLDAEGMKKYGFKAYNFSVLAPMVEDLYCVLEFILEHNRRPVERIILGVDVLAFHNNRPSDRLLAVPVLSRYLDENDPLATLPEEKVMQKVSTSTRFTFVSLFNAVTGSERDVQFELVPENGNLADTPVPPYDHPPVVDSLTAQSYWEHYQGYTALDPRRERYFERFLEICEGSGIEVIACITPMQTVMEKYLAQTTSYTERKADLIAYLDTLEFSCFRYYDLSTVDKFGGLEQDFRDSVHFGSVNAELLLQRMLEDYPGVEAESVPHS